MASIAPLGFLVTNFVWQKTVFAMSQDRPDWSGRVFGKKIPNIFGCSIGGLPLISSMFSFPYVKERVSRWNEQKEKINSFISEMENFQDVMMLGQRPHEHHLLEFETPFMDAIAEAHSKKGYFLFNELKKRRIVGIHAGKTKNIKLSIYDMTDDEIGKFLESFSDIVKHGNKKRIDKLAEQKGKKETLEKEIEVIEEKRAAHTKDNVPSEDVTEYDKAKKDLEDTKNKIGKLKY